ncbi:MAG TPA: muconolactone Delta-isomerase family protein [Solirubrobacteraceae bacterium]|jgi:muconolactone D-isomerase
MLFHVTMTVRLPPDIDAETAAQLNAREHEHAEPLQRSGKWLHLWRVAGRWENVSIFDVTDPGELNDILSSLPLYPYMDVEVAALCHHPGAVAVTD